MHEENGAKQLLLGTIITETLSIDIGQCILAFIHMYKTVSEAKAMGGKGHEPICQKSIRQKRYYYYVDWQHIPHLRNATWVIATFTLSNPSQHVFCLR